MHGDVHLPAGGCPFCLQANTCSRPSLGSLLFIRHVVRMAVVRPVKPAVNVESWNMDLDRDPDVSFVILLGNRRIADLGVQLEVFSLSHTVASTSAAAMARSWCTFLGLRFAIVRAFPRLNLIESDACPPVQRSLAFVTICLKLISDQVACVARGLGLCSCQANQHVAAHDGRPRIPRSSSCWSIVLNSGHSLMMEWSHAFRASYTNKRAPR